eukprot:TRINITY_DN15818_c0_g1_i3.p1 TRINITY_DN15818_c0_g1~~TRINITY_DN15818_c0_g1_i3.p1  ORF type:complete len:259 (+),score=50.72 TRINITY_DN15818_c0_g1_i3:39-779(+)
MKLPHRLAALTLTVLGQVSGDCPGDCPKHCPSQELIQSDFVRNHFDLSNFWGTFYEIAYHDSTQPTNIVVNARCQRSVKSPHPGDAKNYKDLFSMRVGPFGGTNAVCDLEFNISDSPGVFLGHWHSSSPFNPNLENINNTVVDVGVADNGTYEWTLEFQCKEDEHAGKGIRFAAVNFYHRKPLIDDQEFEEMQMRLRARGLGWIIDASPGLHKVDQKSCVDVQDYPAVDAPPAWCGQALETYTAVI